MRITGILLIIVGVIMLVWTGFSFTKKEKIVDAGPIEISADRKETVNWPPYLGGVMIVGGILLLVLPQQRK